MDSPDQSRSYTKWEAEGGSDAKSDRAGDNGDCDGTEKRKHRSSRSKKSGGSGDDSEGKQSNGERSEGKRKSGSGSVRADSNEDDDYGPRKESRAKKKQEESSLDKLSSWYRDGEAENKQEATERKKLEGSSRSRSKSKEEISVDAELEKSVDRDSKLYSDRRDTRSSRRRWDETEVGKKGEEINSERAESRSGKGSDSSKYESPRAKSESRSRGLDYSREERKGDRERSKSKGRSDPVEEDERPTREKPEKEKQQRSLGRDVSETRDRSLHPDEDGNSGVKENCARRQHDSDYEMDYERSYKRKEIEKDGYKDDRSKGRDKIWSERSNNNNRDREGSKESWKRRQSGTNDKETKNEDPSYDRGRDWEIPRHARERGDNERQHGRPGNRKDGNRGEAVKTSSNFGISNENYDVIEIQTKPLDYGRADSGPNFTKKFDGTQQFDIKPVSNDEDYPNSQDDKPRRPDEDPKERYPDEGKGRGQKPIIPGSRNIGPNLSTNSQILYGSQEPNSFNRGSMQGMKGNRLGRGGGGGEGGGRGRPSGRDGQQVQIPLPIMASPFGPLAMAPPGPMHSLNPSMPPGGPGPPMSPGVFIPPFSPPVWAGTRGVDLNMLAGVPPGPRFPPSIASPANPAMYFNPSGPGRGGPLNISGPGFNVSGPMGRGNPADKAPGGWVPQKSNGLPGKALSRGEQNDYSQNFVDTGMRPQNFIRELELTNVVEDYPKLRELIQKKDEIVAKSASPPMYYQCDIKEFELSSEFFGTKFDVILVDPPWEEYVHRAPGVADHMEYWTFEEIMNLKIEAIADTPSFIFLWVGDGVGLEQGRQCLKKWGFRRCEDICWVKTNKNNATPGLRHDSHTLFQHSKEHCLMGIKGTVRRSTDGHIIHANIDTDVIIAEEPPYGSTQKPEDMYRIIEHFALGRRRLELFGEDHNIRSGWLTVGKDLSSSNFKSEAYTRSFGDKDGKVWQGGGGRNPPPETPHLVVTTPEIESLRPKSPMKNQQQLQQQASAASLTTASSSNNRRATANSPQNPNVLGPGPAQEASSYNASSSSWVPPPMEIFKDREPNSVPPPGDVYAFGARPNGGEFLDFEQGQMNLL